MSSLHFCKYPENASYTLSKQPLGTWPCGTSLISSMEIPLYFPPNSAGWPQRHRLSLCQCSSFQQQRLRTKQNPQKWDPHERHSGYSHTALGSCFNSAPVPGATLTAASCTPAARAHICMPWEAAGSFQATARVQTDVDTEGYSMKTECKLPWYYRQRAPCWALNQSVKWVQETKYRNRIVNYASKQLLSNKFKANMDKLLISTYW